MSLSMAHQLLQSKCWWTRNSNFVRYCKILWHSRAHQCFDSGFKTWLKMVKKWSRQPLVKTKDKESFVKIKFCQSYNDANRPKWLYLNRGINRCKKNAITKTGKMIVAVATKMITRSMEKLLHLMSFKKLKRKKLRNLRRVRMTLAHLSVLLIANIS